MNRRNWLHALLVLYILAAGLWWGILLLSKVNQVHDLQKEIWHLENDMPKDVAVHAITDPGLEKIHQEKKRQTRMVFSEGLVFIGLLFLGIYLVYRSFRREIQLAEQKQNFLLSITHELKSPIAGVKLILETFQQRQLSPSQAQGLAENGVRDANRLNLLVENLLVAARMDDSFELAKNDFDVFAFAEEIERGISNKYKHRILKLKLPETSFDVHADHWALFSVFFNLVDNAMKYSKEESEVILSFQKVGSNLIGTVEDFGQGIPEGELSKIFDRFYRVGNELTRETKGTGLGLFIVDQIVKAHKGKVTVQNKEKRGTIFTVEIPSQ